MKKTVVILLLTFLGVFILTSICFAKDSNVYDFYNVVRLVIGEKEAEVNFEPASLEQPAYLKNGRTLVPFRFIGEALGAEISCVPDKNQAKLKLGNTEVMVTLGSKIAYVNGRMQQLDVPAESTGGRTFIPLRFVSESLGANVNYYSDTQTVEVSSVNTSNWVEYEASLSGLKYMFPAGWDVEPVEDNTKVLLTSPRGSKMWLYWAKETPENVKNILTKQAEENGFEFFEEVLDVPKDVNQGYYFAYNKTDQITNVTYRYTAYVDPIENGSILAEILLPIDDYFRMEIDTLVKAAYE